MGCVLPAGQGQAPARQAALGAGLPNSVPCTTVNKMCGSGMKTVMMAYEALHARPTDIVVAGGMESMTNAPYLLPKMRAGARLGHAEVKDHMFLDGLEDAYDKGRLMGTFAEECAQSYQFTREAQDAFAIESLKRSKAANENGAFAKEIVPVAVKTRTGSVEVTQDEQPFTADPGKIPKLKPAFRDGGTVTAANSSSISDGAAALVLMRESEAKRRKLTPLAKISGVASVAQAPALFTTAPVGAVRKLLEAGRLERQGCRPLRGQRGLRGRHHGGHARSRRAAREDERARRRLRAGAPDRGIRCAHHRHAARRHGEVRREQGRGVAVHRRRRGDGRRGRAHRVRTIHTEIGIGAPAAKVWDVLIATDTWAEWNPFAKANGRFAVGERVAVTLTPPGKSAVTMRPIIVKLERGP